MSGRFCRQNPDSLINFLKERVDFLNSIWIENQKMVSIRLDTPENDCFVADSIPEGGCLKDSIYYHIGEEWINSKTGETINPDIPITEDMVLIKKQTAVEQAATDGEDSDTRVFVVMISAVAFVGLFVIMVAIDIWRRKKERRNESD